MTIFFDRLRGMFKVNSVSRWIEMLVAFVGMSLISFLILGVPFCLKFTSLVQDFPRLVYTSDATAAANMYMVFSALLVAGLAMVLTLSGVWISIVITKQKEVLVRENIDDIVQRLVTSEQYAKELISALSDKNPLRAHIDNVIGEKTKQIRQDVTINVLANVGKRIESLEAEVKRIAADKYKPAATEIKKDLAEK